MSLNSFNSDLYLRPLQFLDSKWIRADLKASLRNVEDAAVLWNTLIQDCELVSSPAVAEVNPAGHLSYLGDNGKHYCGVQKLQCTCCPVTEYCGPSSACNCTSCHTLDSDAAIKKSTMAQAAATSRQFINSDGIFKSWLWDHIPNDSAKKDCQRILLNELHEIALQAGSNCLSAQHFRWQLYIYERYFVALIRCKQLQTTSQKQGKKQAEMSQTQQQLIQKRQTQGQHHEQYSDVRNAFHNNEKVSATMGFARVCTRAALNFSFFFLRKAWRSGEDIEMCSELLSEALESLQELPDALLFDLSQISPLWIEVLERSTKFLRQVALGDPMGNRCTAPKDDRHTALCLLLELGIQKGTLAASLENVVILLTLWEQEKACDDNREVPRNTDAPLLPILDKYASIGSYEFVCSKLTETSSSATECFLRLLTLPDEATTNIDLRKAAVVIMSRLDQMSKPYLPSRHSAQTIKSHQVTNKIPSESEALNINEKSLKDSHNLKNNNFDNLTSEPQLHEQRIYALGWLSLYQFKTGFTAEPAVSVPVCFNNVNTIPHKYSAPILNFYFHVKQVVISEIYVLFLTKDGKIYTWRISKPETEPMLIEEFNDIEITSVAAHYESRHYLALDKDGNVYSWGNGEYGCLGHGDTLSREHPTKIKTFEQAIESIYVSCNYSAAITVNGNLYTWGSGTYGRLGHGSVEDKFLPTEIMALSEYKIKNVALGSCESHTMAVTTSGLVYVWGDGSFGKLGNGHCNGTHAPQLLSVLCNVLKVYAGAQFSIALTSDGKLYTWGKASGGCLGHGQLDTQCQYLSTPRLITGLKSQTIVDVAVGAAHCMALSSNGEVFGWGRNDYQQICPTSICNEALIKSPILVIHSSVFVHGIACGGVQSIIWSQTVAHDIPQRIPFVIDLNEQTFRLLDQLLGMVYCTNLNSLQVLHQESECIAVASLNLLRLQFYALITNSVSVSTVGLSERSQLLISLKTRILSLAGDTNVLPTIQEAAQSVLQVGWRILLPTASERAQTLSSILPTEPGISNVGHRFMTDLLVGSLMAEAGLESALDQAMQLESNGSSCHNLPLLHLIKQLLRNNTAVTQAKLTQLLRNTVTSAKANKGAINHLFMLSAQSEGSLSLDLLHRFQRLLLSHIHQNPINEDISGAEILLFEYLQSLVSHCTLSLQKAHEVGLKCKEGVADILLDDISDTLLYELLIGLILLKRDRTSLLTTCNWCELLVPLLHALDNLNRLIGDSEIQDSDDMGWPGILCRNTVKSFSLNQCQELRIIRKNDLENHILDGGKWIILNGFVCDISKYQCDAIDVNDLLCDGVGKDLSAGLSKSTYRLHLENILNYTKVGRYAPSIQKDEKLYYHQHHVSTHFNSERALAYFLGLIGNTLQKALSHQTAELHCMTVMNANILSGGLQVLQPTNPYDEEKGEARSSNSTAGNTPTEPPIQNFPIGGTIHGSKNVEQRIDAFIIGLAEGRLMDVKIMTWLAIVEVFYKDNNLIWHQDFPAEHPVKELERLLTSVLIRHQSLGDIILALIERQQTVIIHSNIGDGVTVDSKINANLVAKHLPKSIADVLRLIYQTKWSVVRIRQQLNRSYKEVCAPILERLRFLLYEIRPVISFEQDGLKHLILLHTLPRFKRIVRRIISDIRIAKKQLVFTKPEDILNVTIQNQNAAQKLNQSQEFLFGTNRSHSLSVTSNDLMVHSANNIVKNRISASLTKNSSIDDVLESSENKLNISSENKLFTQKRKLQNTEPYFGKKLYKNECLNADVERKIRETCYCSGDVNPKLMNEIVDFVMQNSYDVETVRRAMYCQLQRYQIRCQGLEMFSEILQVSGLLDAVEYNMFNGYLGLFLKDCKHITTNILEDLNCITAFQKCNLIFSQARIIEWAICELQRLVNLEQIPIKSKQKIMTKDNSNLGTYVFLKRLPRARFMLGVFGILAKDFGGNELSLVINMGLLGTLLGLLGQIGGEFLNSRYISVLSVVYEDTIMMQKNSTANLSGPELAKLMKIGTRVVRGADWKWGDQDGNPSGEGRIISEVGDDGWVRVEWYTGATNSYRMGKEGQYDLYLADSALNIISPDSESDKDNIVADLSSSSSESHPTKLLRNACLKLLQILSIGIGIHAEQMDKNSVKCLASMYRSILTPNSPLGNISGLNHWTSLGFLKSIAGDSKTLSKHLTSEMWLRFYIELLEKPTASEVDVFRKVHCIRLLQAVLSHWKNEMYMSRMNSFIRQIFTTLGKLTLYCPDDMSLLQVGDERKPRMLLTASHSSTVAEEIVTMIRRLHTLPIWNTPINIFLEQKLCVAAEIFGEDGLDLQNLENEYISVMGVLSVIGGYDLRPRVGLQVNYDGCSSTICGFTTKGKCLLSTGNQSMCEKFRKISLLTAIDCADYSVFSFSRLPMNEMLLNAWSILLYGPGERKETVPNTTDISLLRSQQIQLAVLNANCVLYRHQAALRKILKQCSPDACCYLSEENSSEDDNFQKTLLNANKNNADRNKVKLPKDANVNKGRFFSLEQHEPELLIQSLLIRATQPSPVKSCYTYNELSTAALNCAQVLSSQIHAELHNLDILNVRSGFFMASTQPTMIHGKPIYYSDTQNDVKFSCCNTNAQIETKSSQQSLSPVAMLTSHMKEMGFDQRTAELAIKQLYVQLDAIPTADKVVQWILEHPEFRNEENFQKTKNFLDVATTVHLASTDQDQDLAMTDSLNACYDNESMDSNSNTMVGLSITQDQSIKFDTFKDFDSSDQYAMYVRGLVCPGMIVRCCKDFEEISQNDVGVVLKVDTDDLHDLNVQVDWKMHGNTYWMCFAHIEMLEMPHAKNELSAVTEEEQRSSSSMQIVVGSQVRLREALRYKWKNVIHGSVGTVTSVNGKEVIVDFPQHAEWKGFINDIDVIEMSAIGSTLLGLNSLCPSSSIDLIDDWSRCIRSLTVSSNASMARHLLDRSSNYWQSSSRSQSKHWIRLEMHDNILVHSLAIEVNPNDNSHMPSLVLTRVGDSTDNLKAYSWKSIKNTDTVVVLMTQVRQYYPWIEVVIKQCRNNGIQCKVHALHIIGQRKQTDLDWMLSKASFLACEYDNLNDSEQNLIIPSLSQDEKTIITDSEPCTVMVWGLNDKEQLGGLKGSKIKVPTFSQSISRLRPIYIAGGSKSLFIVSQDGKVYACGEGTNGRLGLGTNASVSLPKQIPILHQYVIKKIAVHSGGKHALALTLDGKVFSWGEGEDGKLGHGNRLTMEKPKMIEALRSKKIRDIACGSSHSAAITSAGELYTWGLGEYGRLGHGDNVTQLKPKVVTALAGKHIIQVACGSRDAQTLALTDDGAVYSWGDGDFGKLGRGGSEGSSMPHEIDRLNGIGVIQIECGAQFSLALTRTGEVWTWGKGDYYRLGHGSDQHIRKPQPVIGLRGHKVIHVAVGALHCLAVTDTGQVYAWGDNDHGQQGSGNTLVNKNPSIVIGLDAVFVNRVACGSSHSVAWGLPQFISDDEKTGPVPFVTIKDPLGGASLGIYNSESPDPSRSNILNPFKQYRSWKSNLSEILLSLEINGARQTALNYVLNAMSILQARHLVIAALTSHSKVSITKNLKVCEKQSNQIPNDVEIFKKRSNANNTNHVQESVAQVDIHTDEFITQGGGEAPVNASNLLLQENSSPELDVAPINLVATGQSPFQSLTGSQSLSASMSSAAPHKHSKMSASAMSVLVATVAIHEEMMVDTGSLYDLDDFTSTFGETEAKSLVELLKLSVAGRAGPPNASQTIVDTLMALVSNNSSIGAMLLEICVTELEDLCMSRHRFGRIPKAIMQESNHPYGDNVVSTGHVKIPGAEALRLEFDPNCSTERRNDPLVIMDGCRRIIATRSGREISQWASEIRIYGDEMRWKFTSDGSLNGWGWRFWVHAIMPANSTLEQGSDRAVLSQPSMPLVMALLDHRLIPSNQTVLIRLASALITCSQLNFLNTSQRIWSLKRTHTILLSKYAPKSLDSNLNRILKPLIPELLRQYEYEEPQVRGGIHLMHSDYFKTLAALACDMQLDAILPKSDVHKWAWFKRYCIAVRVAQSLIKRSELPKPFLLEVRKKFMDMQPQALSQSQQTAGGVINSSCMINSTTSIISTVSTSSNPTLSPQAAGQLPITPPQPPFLHSVILPSQTQIAGPSSSLEAVVSPSSNSLIHYADSFMSTSMQFLYEDHNIFKHEHDKQLLQWLNSRPDDWALSWNGASTIYGWGHNHRGQLGGLEGSRIKSPTPCDALSLLRPVQLSGGEQTLFAVTPDGKLFATGYGCGGRLGVGGTDSWTVPTLVSSLQHVFVKKVSVNSGGKHCLVLTTDGEVYSWGEGEDGKLGHGNRVSYDRPKLIEDLNGIGIVDIACGSAHSAAITSSGHVLTWGKGRYGRLGHGDSEDQLRPKLVEALLGYRAVDIACGSGDAQTLCITDDDNVWSWGDGDYGKLGRGGSDGCKIPVKIESLSGLGVIKVECGSQFSVALTKSGAVYTWGKGDFNRLGHGSVDHVRSPKKVTALQGQKVVSIATGSLHCVACTDSGEVYTWGDNDEGQLGDGTVSAIPRPRLVQALVGKHIVKVTCGSAHTLALSTMQLSERVRPPPNPPLEYDLVRDLTPEALHARLILLHHFSELLCPCMSMLPISGELSLAALKDILVYTIKEASFRKVIQTTMVRDKQHGPVIELNRIQVKRSRNKSGSGLAGVDGMKSVFGQMVQKLPLLTQEALSLPHRVWKVKFVGESVDDCGGGYSESIAEICDELQNGSVPLLIATPNGRGEAGANRDCFLLDPTLTSVLQLNMFRFLGVLMGIAIRTGSPLSLNLAEPVWRQLAGEQLQASDLTEIDRDFIAGLLCIRNMADDMKAFKTLELPFSISSAKGHEIPLSTRYTHITCENRHEYIRLALSYRLHEFDEQVKAVRDGMSKVVPVPLLSLFSANELQAMVCGSPDIPLGLLKSVATYKGFDVNGPLVQWFWEVMEEFTNQERSLFLRFVWGRTRLPRTIADFRGRDFVLQVLEKTPPDHFLPESYTCFFLLKMPRYSCKAILMEKLKYAIHFCKSIDTDEYARVAMGDRTEASGSEENSDIESVGSPEA